MTGSPVGDGAATDDPDAIAELLATEDDDRRFELLVAFLSPDPAASLVVGQRLLGDPDPRRRTLGADILGKIAGIEPSFARQIAEALIPRVPLENDASSLQAAIAALGHTRDERARRPVMACANHGDVDVRLAVAWMLPSLGLDRESVAVLIQLSRDVDDDVRDWATFGLAQGELFGLAQSDAADPEIIEALFARSEDPHYDTRCEAILGLALRHDPRARALVDRELAQPMVGALIQEARVALEAREEARPG